MNPGIRFAAMATLGVALAGHGSFAAAFQLDPAVEQAEAQRVAVAAKITPATIAIFDGKGEGGGSGVIVSPAGFAVTNFHVVAPCGPFMKCGLPDGRFVDAVLVGLDPVGDVAVIQLLRKGGDDKPWPVASWGDSDQVAVGDEAFVAGNPFLLATDFQPTITHGIISGTHRYQYPSGTLLEYTDCLQTDASINPGNSGGPLYSGQGLLIGINGRGSFEKRGRVNVGIGYAISANQVRRFYTHLMSGRIVDHASLGATVRTAAGGRVVVDRILEGSDAYRRGLRPGDEIVRLGGREIQTANALQNIVGTFPAGWRTVVVFRRGYEQREVVVRLERLHGAAQLEELVSAQLAKPALPKGDAEPQHKHHNSYIARPGFANYEFNRQECARVLGACPQRGETLLKSSSLRLVGNESNGDEVSITLDPLRASYESPRGRFWADTGSSLDRQLSPPGSGGLLVALQLWRQLLASGESVLGAQYYGQLPWGDALSLYDCISLNHQGILADFYFDSSSGNLIGVELAPNRSTEPCLLQWSDFRLGARGNLPAQLHVRIGDEDWDVIQLQSFTSETP